jgi:hypothetical protein
MAADFALKLRKCVENQLADRYQTKKPSNQKKIRHIILLPCVRFFDSACEIRIV